MTVFINFILAFFIGMYGVKVLSGVVVWIRERTGKLRARPLDCEACLSFWAALILYWATIGFLPAILGALIVYEFSRNWFIAKTFE